MEFKTRVMSEEDIKEISTWKHVAEYSVYDYPPWDIMVKFGWFVTDKEKREKNSLSLLDEEENLIGELHLTEEEEAVIVGLGLKPELCGMGYGKELMKQLKDISKKKYGKKKLKLLVRPFNLRAIKTYEMAGFVKTGRTTKQLPTGTIDYIIMEFEY